MAFTPVDPAITVAGQPTREELFTSFNGNLNDHETRLGNIEAALNKIEVFNDLILNAGQYSSASLVEAVIVWRATATFNLTTAVINQLQAGTSGTIEIDVLQGATSDISLATSMFSTKPSIPFSAGDNVDSSNAVFSTTTVTQNNFMFLNITSLQTGANRFHVYVFGEP